MASSTSEPMAIASPPKLMVLIVNPKACKTRIATSKERGKATREMIVVRKFIRKKNRTMMTNRAPSKRAFWMLSMELLIKRDWRNISVEICTSVGSVFCSSCKDVVETLEESAFDSLVNEINSQTTDVIVSGLAGTRQDRFVLENSSKISAKIWLSLGEHSTLQNEAGIKTSWWGTLLKKNTFKWMVTKYNSEKDG